MSLALFRYSFQRAIKLKYPLYQIKSVEPTPRNFRPLNYLQKLLATLDLINSSVVEFNVIFKVRMQPHAPLDFPGIFRAHLFK